MVQPATNNPRSLQYPVLSTIVGLYNHFISIPQYLRCIVDFFKKIWSFIALVYQVIREETSAEAWRQHKFLYLQAKQEPDMPVMLFAVLFHFLLAVSIQVSRAALWVLRRVLPRYRTSYSQADARVDEVYNQQQRFIAWMNKVNNYEFIVFCYEYRSKMVRHSKRFIAKTVSSVVQAILPSTIARKVMQYLSILLIWEWTSLDHLAETCGLSEFEKRRKAKDGFVRVRLGLPTYNRTKKDDPWQLHRSIMLIEDFPTERDGSLDLRRVIARWNMHSVAILDPGRYEPFEPSDPNFLSKFAIGVLTMRDGFITVVDQPDQFTKSRIKFRQYINSSFIHLFIRVALRASIPITVTYLGYLWNPRSEKWVYSFALAVFFAEHEHFYWLKSSRKSTWPSRYPKGYVHPKSDHYNFWMAA